MLKGTICFSRWKRQQGEGRGGEERRHWHTEGGAMDAIRIEFNHITACSPGGEVTEVEEEPAINIRKGCFCPWAKMSFASIQ